MEERFDCCEYLTIARDALEGSSKLVTAILRVPTPPIPIPASYEPSHEMRIKQELEEASFPARRNEAITAIRNAAYDLAKLRADDRILKLLARIWPRSASSFTMGHFSDGLDYIFSAAEIALKLPDSDMNRCKENAVSASDEIRQVIDDLQRDATAEAGQSVENKVRRPTASAARPALQRVTPSGSPPEVAAVAADGEKAAPKGTQPSGRKQGAWAKDTEPPISGPFSKGPINGMLRELAYRVGQQEQWIRENNGKKIWVQGINSRHFKAWFNSDAMYIKALDREPPKRKAAKRGETGRNGKTSARKAPKPPPSS